MPDMEIWSKLDANTENSWNEDDDDDEDDGDDDIIPWRIQKKKP